MAAAKPWPQRVKGTFLRFWRPKTSRMAVVRDVVVAAGVIVLVLGGVWLYTGQPFPGRSPLVVVESGSMMHGPGGPCLDQARDCSTFGDPGFGRVGTIDPGDLIFVKRVREFDDVETAFGSGSRGGYGGHGDVIVYEATAKKTPIIHRAMLLFLVEPPGCSVGASANPCTFRIPETCSQDFGRFVQPRPNASRWQDYCEGSREPVTLDLQRGGLFLRLDAYPCREAPCAGLGSGFLTKGDNNQPMDQRTATTCCPVTMQQIVGKARGEVPWFGMIKLMLYGNPLYRSGSDPTGDAQWLFLRGRAPWDVWVSLVLTIGAVVAASVAVDAGLTRWRRRRKERGDQAPPSK